MYVYITDFSLQYQRSERPGTELGMDLPAVRRCRTHRLAVAVVTQNGGIGRWRGSGPIGACPRPGGAGPRLRASVLAAAHATVPPDLHGAWRVAALRDAGAWEMRDAAMAYTCARSTRLEHVQALPRKAHAAILLTARPWGAGGSMAGIRHLGRGGLCGAVRHGAGCRSVSLRSTSRTAPGSGCPLRPRCGSRNARGEAAAELRGRTGEPPGRL